MLKRLLLLPVVLSVVAPLAAADPQVHDPAYTLSLVASEPELVTPVATTIDGRGRLLVVESHTHFRPDGYEGPETDRIRLLVKPQTGDARAVFQTFYEASTQTMGLRAGPEDWVYVATRRSVFRLKDADGDGAAELREDLLTLDTVGNYPHNGLSGLAFGPDGLLYVGLGENFGEPLTLVGSDGSKFSGGGEGGHVFRCTLTGAKLEEVATGFWNPFGLCFDPTGRLFSTDNDPDASPPCRLLHVVPAGDYGFQFRYGRAGIHPLQAWDGELPGTLPMAAGLGEAPGGVAPIEGRLWVASWGDHRIERYTLTPRGASVAGTRDVLVEGDENFRPVDLAAAADGAVYFTDWVSRSYTLHGKGRLWKLTKNSGAAADAATFPAPSAEEKRAIAARSKVAPEALGSDDPFLHVGAVWGLATAADWNGIEWNAAKSSQQVVGVLQAMRWRPGTTDAQRLVLLAAALAQPNEDVQIYALRWIADDRLTAHRDAVVTIVDNASSLRLFRVAVAALDRLDADGGKSDPIAPLLRLVEDDAKPAATRAAALSLIPANNPALTAERLAGLIGGDPALSREAVRTLAVGNAARRADVLAAAAVDGTLTPETQADAVLGLAADGGRRGLLDQLAALARGPHADEARRALSPPLTDAERPAVDDLAAWTAAVGEGGDAAAGWRVFFRPNGAGCAKCHAIGGRGASVGPDLTGIGRRMTRERLLDSILHPSREVGPEYVPWVLQTRDGRVLTGLWVDRGGARDEEQYLMADGQVVSLPRDQIEVRVASPTSIMPAGLEKTMTVADLRNLLALLAAER